MNILVRIFNFLFRSSHKWSYRNPHDRTCKTCIRHEVEHISVMTGMLSWEVFHPGVTGTLCSKKGAWQTKFKKY